MKKLYFFSLACLVNAFSITAQTTVSFKINANDDDATIDNYYPNANTPNDIEYNSCGWTINGLPVVWRNLFKFDLTCIPPNATILNADLNLYYAAVNNYSNTEHSSLSHSNETILKRITSYWNENTVTWNNQPSATPVDEVILPQSVNGTQDYSNIDVKEMVQKMVSVPNGNFGFLLKLTNESNYARLIFASGDNPDINRHPFLTVTYTIPQSDCITFRLDKICEDAEVDNYHPSQNNPNEIEYNSCAWTINSAPVIWRSFFKFNLPCGLENTLIQSSHLSLFYATQNNYGNTHHSTLSGTNESVIQRVTSPWTENTITWNNRALSTLQNEVILPSSISGTQDYENIDVTNIVRQMLVNTNQNYGFSLKLTDEIFYSRMIFASGDNPDSSKHPLLEVCYSLITSDNEVKNNNDINIYPTIFQDRINISLKMNTDDSRFNLYNSLGQLVFSAEKLIGNKFSFQLPLISNGLYFYELKDKSSVVAVGKLEKIN